MVEVKKIAHPVNLNVDSYGELVRNILGIVVPVGLGM